jgi:hypothetical protein
MQRLEAIPMAPSWRDPERVPAAPGRRNPNRLSVHPHTRSDGDVLSGAIAKGVTVCHRAHGHSLRPSDCEGDRELASTPHVGTLRLDGLMGWNWLVAYREPTHLVGATASGASRAADCPIAERLESNNRIASGNPRSDRRASCAGD